MKVRCKYSTCEEVVPPLDPEYRFKLSHFLKKDGIYTVYGLYALKEDGKIRYLIIDETGLPSYCISDFFEIVDSQLPIADWHFGLGIDNDRRYAISFELCYEEFVKSQEHYEGVMLNNDDHRERFWKWKEIVDRQYYAPEDEWEKVNADVDGVAINFMRNRRTGKYKDFQFV